MYIEAYMIIGFSISAYAIIANDAIQTLGTFIAANQERHWLQLWGFAASILTAVLLYGWWSTGGDPSYGRLSAFPFDRELFSWLHMIPPIVLLILTRYGLPVSTTFLILTFFQPKNLEDMVLKSISGYGVALVLGGVVFLVVHDLLNRNQGEVTDSLTSAPLPSYWEPIQWITTAFLWSQWLIQDLANLFIFFPHPSRGDPTEIPLVWLCLGLIIILLMQLEIFRSGGGKIQEIVNQKSGSSDLREATMINFIYGVIIFVFKELSEMPMSTTWVFLGLLAGREIAYHYKRMPDRDTSALWRMISIDLGKATLGLLVSVALALGLPQLVQFVK